MYEELTAIEKKEMEISEFLRELVEIISEKFAKQKDVIESINREISSIKNEDIFELKRSIEDLKERINLLDIKLSREEKISKDILDSLIESEQEYTG
jgi:type I site-specific restriction-modification system R (restriction) subunit